MSREFNNNKKGDSTFKQGGKKASKADSGMHNSLGSAFSIQNMNKQQLQHEKSRVAPMIGRSTSKDSSTLKKGKKAINRAFKYKNNNKGVKIYKEKIDEDIEEEEDEEERKSEDDDKSSHSSDDHNHEENKKKKHHHKHKSHEDKKKLEEINDNFA